MRQTRVVPSRARSGAHAQRQRPRRAGPSGLIRPNRNAAVRSVLYQRLAGAIFLGAAAAALVPVLGWKLGEEPVDFLWTQFAVRDWLAGRDVYAKPPHANFIPYPFTAAVLGWPLAWLPMTVAAAVFTGTGVGVLAFALTRHAAWWRLLAIGSSSCIAAIKTVQWSPWLTAALIYPLLAFVWTAKPTYAVLGLAQKPSRAAILLGVAIVPASLILVPDWPWKWASQLGPYNGFVPALGARSSGLTNFPAPWLLVALLRWRNPSARLLALLSIMPQHLYFYDQLALYVIPKTFRQMLILTAFGWLGFWLAETVGFRFGAPIIVLCLYLPALVIVFQQPGGQGGH
jgi:hypothetical protein